MSLPDYSKRLGQYQTDQIRPFLLSFENTNSIKTTLRNIAHLKSSDYKSIIIKHDLTSTRRIIVKDLKTKCDKLNLENKDPNFLWTISDSDSNPKLTKNITNPTNLPILPKYFIIKMYIT